MNRAIAVLIAGLCIVAFGCGSDDDPLAAAKDAAAEAGEAAGNMGDAAGKAMQDVAAGNDPVTTCLALAAKKQWSDALAPCTEAAKAKPDDLAVKHAVQQAQAAAEG